ncbi:DUF3180 family protein [Dermatophilus congolensis]|uniref:DUF3180 family protein n=1 Tax=Dermatophilus congolensis TaxID=1863 RepID=UPI001AB00B38|nr:DUF3180 family protein [Dermatophilus congolensis]MBO3153072.1 DUF3180 family protein [Dermatophilus congolensis]MBO3159908.1 DUF3180 family protein [Dermatophilus congolensis]MBO3164363.1 DUF3180 family protein [Dermatophilus congolensis]MBO3177913.1 DUF3180 family protein [Dermatophilus congolensis]MBO3184680.1 DUF3180 family protein [Dermatophilus congolensis]
MTGDRYGVRWRLLLVVALVAGVCSFGFLSWWQTVSGPLLTPSWGAAVVLLVVALSEVVVGVWLRRVVRGKSSRGLDVLVANRVLLGGQAAALTGAAVAGWFVSRVVVVASDLDAGSVQAGAWAAVAVSVSGVALACGGMFVQRCGRVDPPDGEDGVAAGGEGS